MCQDRMAELEIKKSDLSKNSGVPFSTISEWLRGVRSISLRNFIAILTVLRLNPDFVDNRDPTPSSP